jgi:hypothetical protein
MANSNNNGNSESKAPSRKQALHDQWVAKGSPKAVKKDSLAFIAAYKKAAAAKVEAEAALEAAQAIVSDLVADFISARGKGRVNFDGETYVPMSRGNTCYLRAEGGGEVEKL